MANQSISNWDLGKQVGVEGMRGADSHFSPHNAPSSAASWDFQVDIVCKPAARLQCWLQHSIALLLGKSL